MKKNAKKVKRSITLVELLVVMALIAIISGALAYNYRDSLDKGKAFKTEQLINRIRTVLTIEIAKDPGKAKDIVTTWQKVIAGSSLIHAETNASGHVVDAWGKKITCALTNTDDEISITSEGLTKYNESIEKAKKKVQD